MITRRRLILLITAGLFVFLAIGTWLWATASRRALRSYKAELTARGERLDFHSFASTSTAEARDAARMLADAASPLNLRNSTGVMPNNPPACMRYVRPGRAEVAWARPDIWSGRRDERLTWEQLATELEAQRDNLQMVCEALEAPALDWGIDYSDLFQVRLSHLAALRSASTWLAADAVNELRNRRLEPAAARLRALLRLIRLTEDEPMIISQTVRVGLANLSFALTWEALQAEGWTDSQLAAIQRGWQSQEFLGALARAIEKERAGGIEMFGRCREDPAELQSLGVSGTVPAPAPPQKAGELSGYLERRASSSAGSAFGSLWSTFWSYDDERFYLSSMQRTLEHLRHCAQSGGVARDPGRPEMRPERSIRHWFCGLMLPNLVGATAKASQAQVQRELAVTALALARHRLRHGRFPEQLAELVPAFLDRVPLDWMDGQRMRYRLKPDGSFLLYSVGDDGIDDHGDPSVTANQSMPSFAKGKDLVWPVRATAEEAEGKPRK